MGGGGGGGPVRGIVDMREEVLRTFKLLEAASGQKRDGDHAKTFNQRAKGVEDTFGLHWFS